MIPTTIQEAVLNAAMTFLPISAKFKRWGDQYMTYIAALSHGIWVSMCDTTVTQHSDVMDALEKQIDAIIDDPLYQKLKE